jgi:hypothetical protein
MRLAFGVGLAAVAWAALLIGCQTIAGIDDHAYQASVTPLCAQYCDEVMQACTGQNASYAMRETCLGVCGQLDAGVPNEPTNDNTVACRQFQARLATATSEPKSHCRSAGPGGANECGTNCAAYCTLLRKSCSAQFALLQDCERQCSALRDRGDFDIVTDYSGDTLGCRLVHLSTATVDPATHCSHAQILPTEPCVDNPMLPPDCADSCRLEAVACTGENAIYESTTQCLKVCENLSAGTNADHVENTMGCRRWHMYNALLDPPTHCAHTGPGGDGHCGVDETDKTGNCVSYCILLEKACGLPAAFLDRSACERDCSNRPDSFGAKHDSKYVIASAQTGPTLQCRLLHVSRALEHPENAVLECTSALGLGMCQ